MKKLLATCSFILLVTAVQAQRRQLPARDPEPEDERRGVFKKELLFAAGSVQLGFANGFTLLGASPMVGYSINRFVDAGVVVNYIYSSQRITNQGEKVRQSIYGGGVFARVFPVRFLFLQGQIEQNFISQRRIIPGFDDVRLNLNATSYLVGAGYTTGRIPGNLNMYGYFSVLVDLGNDLASPYIDADGSKLPVIRAGINVPLFQRRNENFNDRW